MDVMFWAKSLWPIQWSMLEKWLQSLKQLGSSMQSSRTAVIRPAFAVSGISLPQKRLEQSRPYIAIFLLVHTSVDSATPCGTCFSWIWLFTPLMRLASSAGPTQFLYTARNGTPSAHGTLMMH